VAAMRAGRLPVRRVQRVAGLLLLQDLPAGQGLQRSMAQRAVAAAAAVSPPVPDRGRGGYVFGATCGCGVDRRSDDAAGSTSVFSSDAHDFRAVRAGV